MNTPGTQLPPEWNRDNSFYFSFHMGPPGGFSDAAPRKCLEWCLAHRESAVSVSDNCHSTSLLAGNVRVLGDPDAGLTQRGPAARGAACSRKAELPRCERSRSLHTTSLLKCFSFCYKNIKHTKQQRETCNGQLPTRFLIQQRLRFYHIYFTDSLKKFC